MFSSAPSITGHLCTGKRAQGARIRASGVRGAGTDWPVADSDGLYLFPQPLSGVGGRW